MGSEVLGLVWDEMMPHMTPDLLGIYRRYENSLNRYTPIVANPRVAAKAPAQQR